MTRVLMVCVGNVCRSPLAERLLAARAAAAGVPVRTESAGMSALVGSPMEATAAIELSRLGGSPDGFVARRLTGLIASGPDLVLTATKQLRAEVLREAPGAIRRTFTLREFAALCDLSAEIHNPRPDSSATDLISAAARSRSRVASLELDVTDPIGLTPEVHRRVADEIADAVDRIVAGLARA